MAQRRVPNVVCLLVLRFHVVWPKRAELIFPLSNSLKTTVFFAAFLLNRQKGSISVTPQQKTGENSLFLFHNCPKALSVALPSLRLYPYSWTFMDNVQASRMSLFDDKHGANAFQWLDWPEL